MSYGQQTVNPASTVGDETIQQPALKEYCNRLEKVAIECLDMSQTIRQLIKQIMPHEIQTPVSNEVQSPMPPTSCAMDEMIRIYNLFRDNNNTLQAALENLRKIV